MGYAGYCPDKSMYMVCKRAFFRKEAGITLWKNVLLGFYFLCVSPQSTASPPEESNASFQAAGLGQERTVSPEEWKHIENRLSALEKLVVDSGSGPLASAGEQKDEPVSVTEDKKISTSRELSEDEQNSYVAGMLVADYTRSVLLILEKLDMVIDAGLLREGLLDTLENKPLLDGEKAQLVLQRFQREKDRRQDERDVVARQKLASLAGKQDTLEKRDDRVWVRLKKGVPVADKQNSFSLSWEGRLYGGVTFEAVDDLSVTRRDVLPSWLQHAIRLAGVDGKVRLYIMAGSLEEKANLPAGTARHEVVQYTVSVNK